MQPISRMTPQRAASSTVAFGFRFVRSFVVALSRVVDFRLDDDVRLDPRLSVDVAFRPFPDLRVERLAIGVRDARGVCR